MSCFIPPHFYGVIAITESMKKMSRSFGATGRRRQSYVILRMSSSLYFKPAVSLPPCSRCLFSYFVYLLGGLYSEMSVCLLSMCLLSMCLLSMCLLSMCLFSYLVYLLGGLLSEMGCGYVVLITTNCYSMT